MLMAGMMGIDASLFEAAEVDGATSMQTFWHITIPLLKPMLVYTCINALIGGLHVHADKASRGSGGNIARFAHVSQNAGILQTEHFNVVAELLFDFFFHQFDKFRCRACINQTNFHFKSPRFSEFLSSDVLHPTLSI